MAKTRKGISYSKKLERPYTRKSRYRKKSFVRASPRSKIIRYMGGNKVRTFTHRLDLKSKSDVQIRDISIEASRQASNRYLERNIGKTDFFSQIRVYPHHILRENPLASGAGADRMSTGMKKSFGKAIGVAARVKKGQVVYSLHVDEKNLVKAREALRKISCKLPCSCSISTEKNVVVPVIQNN
ncbi:MAG: 50S ribosomal protein L16 [Nanoarchaeota archaeon]|nr:50S ribosomal protein L16 [Nanoarchaeota archaeon]